MHYIKNNHGYALLLVLLLIVLFISVSAVFTAASFNHSDQEISVDKTNQTVVAAEMGTKYFNNLVFDKAKSIRNEIIDTYVKTELLQYETNYNQCNDNGFITEECRALEGINTFLGKLNSESFDIFEAKLNEYITLNDYHSSNVSNDLYYVSTNFSPSLINNQYILNFSVYGLNEENEPNIPNRVANEENVSVLNSKITIDIPLFINSSLVDNKTLGEWYDWNSFLLASPTSNQNCLPAAQLTAPYICNTNGLIVEDVVAALRNDPNFENFKDKLEIINPYANKLCKADGNCNTDFEGFKVYNLDGITFNQNANVGSNGTLISQGDVNVPSNAQNLDVNIITNSLTVEMFKNVTGRVLILGTKEKTGTMIFNQASAVDGGKICINLDGLQTITYTRLTGNISVYSTEVEEFAGFPVFQGSYEEFIKSCIPDDLKLPFPSLENNTINVEVNYN